MGYTMSYETKYGPVAAASICRSTWGTANPLVPRCTSMALCSPKLSQTSVHAWRTRGGVALVALQSFATL